jgi:gas vesicle protein
MKTTTKVILGLVAAAAAGAAINMLLASGRSKELQNKIKDGAQDWLNQFSTLLNTGRDVAAQVKAKAQDQIKHLKSEFTEAH